MTRLISIDVIRALRERADKLQHFTMTAADCEVNARVFRSAFLFWTEQGYPEIAAEASRIATGFEIAAQARQIACRSRRPNARAHRVPGVACPASQRIAASEANRRNNSPCSRQAFSLR